MRVSVCLKSDKLAAFAVTCLVLMFPVSLLSPPLLVVSCIDGLGARQQSASEQAVERRWEVASRRAMALRTERKWERALVVLGIGIKRHRGVSLMRACLLIESVSCFAS